MPTFPRLKEVLKAELRQQYPTARPTIQALAKKADMPTSTLQMYLDGRRFPPTDVAVNRLLKCFYDEDCPERTLLAEQIKAAEKSKSPTRRVMDRRTARNRPLRVGALKHPPLSGFEAFAGRLFSNRYLALGEMKTEPQPPDRTEYTSIESLQADVQQMKIDVVLGLLSTVDRAMRLRFVAQTPTRVSLGAVCHINNARHIPRLRELLSGEPSHAPGLRKFRPVVVRHEVGWIHCLRRLGYDESDVTLVDRLDEAAFKKVLEDAEEKSSNLVHVVVVDELTSIRVLGKMDGQGLPVIPLSTERSLRDCPSRFEMPVYSVGIAIARTLEDVAESTAEALPIFMQNDVERIARDYLWTYERLEELIEEHTGKVPLEYLDHFGDHESWVGGPAGHHDLTADDRRLIEVAARQSLARRWARTVLRLTREDIDAYESPLPWRPIMHRTRQMLNRRLHREYTKWIKGYVRAAGKHYQWYFMHRIIRDLQDAFDVTLEDIGAQRYQPITREAPVPMLSRHIASALIGKRENIEPIVHRAEVDNRPEVEMLLQEAASMHTTAIEQKRARRVLYKEMAKFEDVSKNYLIAVIEGEPAGLIHLGEPQTWPLGIAVEVDWLFVRPGWRSFGIGRWLVYKAAAHAAGLSNSHLLVDKVKTPHETLLLYRTLGFEDVTEKIDPAKPRSLFRACDSLNDHDNRPR